MRVESIVTQVVSIPKVLSDLRCELLQQHHTCGIYFLVYKDLIVYIGQSKNVNKRVWKQHGDKKFYTAFFNSFKSTKWLTYWEAAYIHTFKPYYNNKGNRKALKGSILLDDVYESLLAEQRLIDMSDHYIDDYLRKKGHSEEYIQEQLMYFKLNSDK